jgi:MHS family proline/betaine transporter-like MFS transporter
MMVEITPANIRCTALAIGNNIGWSILGGLAPLAATWLTARTGDALAPAWLVAAAAAVTAVTLLLTADPFRRKIASPIVRT